MPSALDLRLEAAYNLITGPGGPIQVGSVERFGRQLPFVTNAPTNLADYVAYFAMQHGDATFLVEGDERNLKVTTPADLALARFLLGQGA